MGSYVSLLSEPAIRINVPVRVVEGVCVAIERLWVEAVWRVSVETGELAGLAVVVPVTIVE